MEEEEHVDEDEVKEFFERYPLTNAENLPKVEERICYHLSGHTIFSAIKLKLRRTMVREIVIPYNIKIRCNKEQNIYH